jgi:hypothetical protein
MFWDGRVGKEEHGFGAGRHVRAVSLAEVAKFIFAGLNPQIAFTASAELKAVSDATSVWM